jgi:glycosyltransferase involved in cell wall biosynthesis
VHVERILVLPREGEYAEWARRQGIRVEIMPWPRLLAQFWRVPGAALRLGRLVRDEQVDIVHTDAPRNSHLAALAGGGAVRVVHLRVSTPDGLSDRLLAAHADALIAVSHGVAERFAGYPASVQRKIRVIHNPVDTERFAPLEPGARRDVRDRLGLPRDAVVAAMVGAIDPVKRHSFFLERWPEIAAGADRPVVLALAGKDPDRKLPSLRRRAAQLGVEDSVHFLGFREDPEELLGASDLVVVPSSEEGFPRVTVEAASCGVPAVVTDAPGLREGVEEGVTGLLAGKEDPEGWVSSVLELVNGPGRRAEMGRRARLRAERLYSLEAHGEAVLDLYRTLLST